jgi:hypothetical protein
MIDIDWPMLLCGSDRQTGTGKLIINLKRNTDWVNSSDHVNSYTVLSRRANIACPQQRNCHLL